MFRTLDPADRDIASRTKLAAALLDGPQACLCAIGHCFQCRDPKSGERTCRDAVVGFETPPPVEAIVIGAGPAGAACALALAAEGVETLLLDADNQAGGNVWRKPRGADGGSGAWLRSRVAAAKHLHHRAGVEVLDIRDGKEVWALDGAGRGHVLRAAAIVVATGAIERNVAVPGWELPGTFNLGGLQALAKGQGIVPDGPVLLAGTGPLLYLVANDLRVAGVTLAAVVDAAGWPTLEALRALWAAPGLAARAFGYVAGLMRAGVPILRNAAVTRIAGAERVERVTVARLDKPARERHFDVSVLGLGYGLLPNTELVQVAGAELVFERALGGWHAAVDGAGETSIPNLYAIGETRGIRGVEAALCDAPETAAAIVARLGRTVSPELQVAVRRAQIRRQLFERAARAFGAWMRVPEMSRDPQTIVCRCETVRRADLDAAAALDLDAPAAIKMATRIGMGFCQGRVCAAGIGAGAGANPAGDSSAGPPRARFPVRPCPANAFFERA